MVGTLDVRRWLGWAGGVADHGQAGVARLGIDLAAQGRRTTSEVSSLLGELFEQNRRRSDDVGNKVLLEVQRRVEALRITRTAPAETRSAELRSVVDEIAMLNRQDFVQLREALQEAAFQQLSALGAVTNTVAELAAQNREYADELRMKIEELSDRQQQALGLMANIVQQVVAMSVRSNNELFETVRHTSETLHDALGIQNQIAAQLDPDAKPADE